MDDIVLAEVNHLAFENEYLKLTHRFRIASRGRSLRLIMDLVAYNDNGMQILKEEVEQITLTTDQLDWLTENWRGNLGAIR